MSLPKDWDQVVSYTLAHAAAWNTVSNLVTSGVCERHPKLRFVMAEWETGWIGHVLQRWDHAYYRARAVDQTPELPMLPTEYFHRQFTVTFEDDAIGVQTRNEIGIENLVWGNDYPHHDAIWPNSRRILERDHGGRARGRPGSHGLGQRPKALQHRPLRPSGIGRVLTVSQKP